MSNMSSWFAESLSQEKKQSWDRILPSGLAVDHDPFCGKLCNYLELDMENGPWLAGGAVRKLYFKEMIGNSDWDIWFSSMNQYQNTLSKIENLRIADLKHTSSNAKTFQLDGHKVQLINRNFYPSVQELLNSFDMTICQFATDGAKFKVGDESIQDCQNKIIRIRKNIINPGIMKRITKYIVYGFYPTQEILNQIESNKDIIQFHVSGSEYDE